MHRVSLNSRVDKVDSKCRSIDPHWRAVRTRRDGRSKRRIERRGAFIWRIHVSTPSFYRLLKININIEKKYIVEKRRPLRAC